MPNKKNKANIVNFRIYTAGQDQIYMQQTRRVCAKLIAGPKISSLNFFLSVDNIYKMKNRYEKLPFGDSVNKE